MTTAILRALPSSLPLLLLLLAAFPPLAAEPAKSDNTGPWPVERLQSEPPSFRIEDPAAPIQSLLYEGEPVAGTPTEIFAFYASPATLGTAGADETFPGIVLIHGGGGTAFSDWVWLWAQRGYAAIAMDLSGHRPPAPRYDEHGEKIPDHGHPRALRTRLPHGGPDQGHEQKFDSIGGTVDDDWPYHAVAAVIRAHTLLRTLPRVDPGRTAVTGISWGGYTTCLVASLDNRFRAAVPVYGCGFLHEGESVQKPSLDRLGDRRDAWVAAYDPSRHLGRCTVPLFWVNGTHDIHYPLDSYAKSAALGKGPRHFRIEPRMAHSHPAGWEPMEIGLFLDSLLKDGTPLPAIDKIHRHASTITAPYSSVRKVVKAELHYTTETGLRSEREWKSLAARIEDDKIIAKGLPPEANTWLITLIDERGAMVTSEVGMRGMKL